VIRLLGIVVLVAGLIFRINPLIVVAAAAVSTGFAAGMSLDETISTLGRAFVDSRNVTVPLVLVLVVVGLLEQHGLRKQAEALIHRARSATAGRVIWIYSAIRQISAALGVNLGGHAGAVRPLVAPMAEAAARSQYPILPTTVIQAIRAHAAAAENIGNFFGEDIFVAVGAVLLMRGFFQSQGIEVSSWAMALWGLPTAVVASATMAWRARRLDVRIRRATANPPDDAAQS
jgi:uncharacterized membrane protein